MGSLARMIWVSRKVGAGVGVVGAGRAGRKAMVAWVPRSVRELVGELRASETRMGSEPNGPEKDRARAGLAEEGSATSSVFSLEREE